MLVNFNGDCQVCLNFGFDESGTKPIGKDYNFNPTDDGKSSENSHGASNQAELALSLDLLVSHNLVVGGRVKEDVDELKR